jgi:hypothetical protein
MAAHVETITTFVDDITGEAGEDVKMYSYGLEGVWYDIDLSDKTAEKVFLKFVNAVTPHARVSEDQDRKPARSSRKGTAGSEGKRTAQEIADARAWAAQQGLEISPKGRIPRHVWEAYDAAEPTPAAG